MSDATYKSISGFNTNAGTAALQGGAKSLNKAFDRFQAVADLKYKEENDAFNKANDADTELGLDTLRQINTQEDLDNFDQDAFRASLNPNSDIKAINLALDGKQDAITGESRREAAYNLLQQDIQRKEQTYQRGLGIEANLANIQTNSEIGIANDTSLGKFFPRFDSKYPGAYIMDSNGNATPTELATPEIQDEFNNGVIAAGAQPFRTKQDQLARLREKNNKIKGITQAERNAARLALTTRFDTNDTLGTKRADALAVKVKNIRDSATREIEAANFEREEALKETSLTKKLSPSELRDATIKMNNQLLIDYPDDSLIPGFYGAGNLVDASNNLMAKYKDLGIEPNTILQFLPTTVSGGNEWYNPRDKASDIAELEEKVKFYLENNPDSSSANRLAAQKRYYETTSNIESQASQEIKSSTNDAERAGGLVDIGKNFNVLNNRRVKLAGKNSKKDIETALKQSGPSPVLAKPPVEDNNLSTFLAAKNKQDSIVPIGARKVPENLRTSKNLGNISIKLRGTALEKRIKEEWINKGFTSQNAREITKTRRKFGNDIRTAADNYQRQKNTLQNEYADAVKLLKKSLKGTGRVPVSNPLGIIQNEKLVKALKKKLLALDAPLTK